jgi:hypothetical protein
MKDKRKMFMVYGEKTASFQILFRFTNIYFQLNVLHEQAIQMKKNAISFSL